MSQYVKLNFKVYDSKGISCAEVVCTLELPKQMEEYRNEKFLEEEVVRAVKIDNPNLRGKKLYAIRYAETIPLKQTEKDFSLLPDPNKFPGFEYHFKGFLFQKQIVNKQLKWILKK